MKAWSSEKISILALVLLITGAIDSIRNLPTTALFGAELIFYFIFSALIFLIPVALVSAELSSTWSDEEGGIYSWVKHAFGENFAFFTIWLQWINTIVWFPTILLFIAGTLSYLIDPALSQHKWYMISVELSVFWLLTALGLKGLRASSAFAGFCTVVGVFVPMGVIILLVIIWLVAGNPMAIDLSFKNCLPHWGSSQSWVSLTAIMTSFLGMELAAVHVRNIDTPQRNFPKAIFLSVFLILSTMILGSLAIALILPSHEINLVDGVMQVFSNFFAVYELEWLMPVIVILILLGSLGSMVNWIISPSKSLLMASEHGFIPQWLAHRNEHGIPSRILLLQAGIVTLISSAFLLIPSINGIYWLFTALSTELYIMMYVMMFLAAIRLKSKFAHLPRPYAIMGGKWGYYAVCALGLFGCIMTLIVGFIPPAERMDVGNALQYQLIFGLGIFMMLVPALILYLYKRKKG